MFSFSKGVFGVTIQPLGLNLFVNDFVNLHNNHLRGGLIKSTPF